MKILLFLFSAMIIHTAYAECSFNGKNYKPMESVTLFDSSYRDLPNELKKKYANGEALTVVCKPVLNLSKFGSQGWSRDNLPISGFSWVAMDDSWKYREVTFTYLDKSITIFNH